MKFLVALALVVLAVAEAHHTSEHTLRGSRFQTGRIYKYDVEFNVTSGLEGLSTQFSKVAYKAEVSIYAKNEKDHILKVENVYTSGSVKAIDSRHGFVRMEKNSELEDKLSVPIKFTLEQGEVTSYTLSPREDLESKKIKKSILRSLEMHVPETALQQMESDTEMRIPVIYNVTKDTDSGVHTAHYLITVSPYAEFPAHQSVYNITRSDDFEAERYPAHIMHHNFNKQGCSEVCRKDWRSNKLGAGCPVGYEPHQSPIKMSFNHQHHLSLRDKVMNPELIYTTETHVAQMYDQDMEVLILYRMRRKSVSIGTIVEPSEQQTYTDLKDWTSEINEKEIDAICQYKTAEASVESAITLLRDISKIIVKGDLDDENSALIGQKIIQLKNAMKRLAVANLVTLSSHIKEINQMVSADGEDKVMRQVWMNILPLIGTEESVTFITKYIKEGLEAASKKRVLVWEAKEILEALPENIHRPSERNIRELKSLTESSTVKNNHFIHSAVHLTVARVISELCGNVAAVRSEPVQKSSWFSYQRAFQSLEESNSESYGPIRCPESLVKEIVQDITEKLSSSQTKEDIVVYLETLVRIGVPEVLPVISKYIYGTAQTAQQFSPSYIDFMKTVSLFALHNMVGKYPEEVLQIVLPVYFNGTENPKVRNAAFGVAIRCQPSLEVLQHIVVRSWEEESKEVGSFVTSTLESFGNASLPCMQLTSDRIKKVMPHLKRFDIGIHHSKNLLWSYFDDQREFGLEHRLEYTPSNESIIPSTLYHALSYSTDSLRDVLIQMALNVQGLTRETIIKKIEDFLNLTPVTAFDSETERKIFEKADIRERVPEALRFTIYKRMFYTSSYYYLDSETSHDLKKSLFEYIRTYVTKGRGVDGHLVKVFLPSTYHAVTIAKTLPYPVEFEMKQPLILAVRVKSLEREIKLRKFHFHIRPSVYFTKLYTNQLKNIGDCQEVGVYHETKVAVSYPFELKFQGIDFPNITIKYKIPELRKKVLTYSSEAGTYAGKKTHESLPSTSGRVPIRTLPTPFKIEKDVTVVGVPPLHMKMHTEDIGFGTEPHPRDFTEAVDYAVRKIMNAGWRYKSVNVTLQENSRVWPSGTEVTFTIRYSRDHMRAFTSHSEPQRNARKTAQPEESQRSREWASDSQWGSQFQDEDQSKWNSQFQDEDQSQWNSQSRNEDQSQWNDQEDFSRSWPWRQSRKEDDDWNLKPDDISRNGDPKVFIDQGRKVVEKMHMKPHIKHTLKIEIETKPKITTAFIKVEYNHTYDKGAHSVRVDAAAKPNRNPHTYEVTLDHFMVFMRRPNEFKYSTQEPEQVAIFVSALGLPGGSPSRPWEKVETVVKGMLSYESLEHLLKNDLLSRVDPKYYQPETHEECLRDVENGKALSLDCVKAIREKSIYNKLIVSVLWKERLPEVLKALARRVDIYTKHYLFHHLNLTDVRSLPNRMQITLNHIDKFTDKPVFDLRIVKPNETVEFRRIPTFGFHPLSSVYTQLETVAMQLTNNSYPPTCVMMERYVRTFDERTYRFSAEDCNYVLSTHCTQNKYFAITARGLKTPRGAKEVRIYVGDKTVLLTPKSGETYTIRMDGMEHHIEAPVMLDEDHEIYAYPIRTKEGVNLQVVARRASIFVLYDGVNIKVQVDPRYKGELCGLCSELDGEELREYRGMDRCLYNHPIDFANSAITNREGSCEKSRLLGKKICDSEESYTPRRVSEDDEYEPTTRRNIVKIRGNEYCFSVLPVPVCEDNAQPIETKPQRVAFHCLPKMDVTAKRLLTESKRRVLGEIAYKSTDLEETVQVAKMC